MATHRSIRGDTISVRFEIRPDGGFDEHITMECKTPLDLRVAKTEDTGRFLYDSTPVKKLRR